MVSIKSTLYIKIFKVRTKSKVISLKNNRRVWQWETVISMHSALRVWG